MRDDKVLIAEARRLEENYGDRYEVMTHMSALADALEARQPSEDDREATEAEIDKAARALHMAKCCSLSGDSPHDFPEASEVFAAGVVLNAVPRAAVPDAATERARQAEAELRDMLRVDIPSLKAERDASVAALERVRAIHAPEVVGIHEGYGEEVWCPTCEHHYPCPTVAALDGAPEPEWEYTWAGTDSEGDDWVMDDVFTTRDSAESYLGRPIGRWVATDNGELVRRRKAGPWLPVEGESK